MKRISLGAIFLIGFFQVQGMQNKEIQEYPIELLEKAKPSTYIYDEKIFEEIFNNKKPELGTRLLMQQLEKDDIAVLKKFMETGSFLKDDRLSTFLIYNSKQATGRPVMQFIQQGTNNMPEIILNVEMMLENMGLAFDIKITKVSVYDSE